MRKRWRGNSNQYDTSVINSGIFIDILDKMAEKAFRQHSLWKLLLSDSSGTWKSAYDYHIIEKLVIEGLVKRPQDLLFKYFGESETVIASVLN